MQEQDKPQSYVIINGQKIPVQDVKLIQHWYDRWVGTMNRG